MFFSLNLCGQRDLRAQTSLKRKRRNQAKNCPACTEGQHVRPCLLNKQDGQVILEEGEASFHRSRLSPNFSK